MNRKNLFMLVILGALFVPAMAFAGTKEEFAKCAAKESDSERLICYDNLADSMAVNSPKATVTTGKGKWFVRNKKSPIDDSVNVFISLQSENEITSGYNTVRPSLYIRCAENKTNVYIVWELYLGIDTTRMLTRFDKNRATTTTWSISTDNKAVFFKPGFLSGISDKAFVKKLMKHNRLLTQITPYGESPVMATFDVKGLSEAVKPLRQACHW